MDQNLLENTNNTRISEAKAHLFYFITIILTCSPYNS